jgi:cardiolipin synthase
VSTVLTTLPLCAEAALGDGTSRWLVELDRGVAAFAATVPWGTMLVLVGAGLAIWASCHALLTKRDPRSAWGWIAMCYLFPFAGPLLYSLFGINRVRIAASTLGLDHAGSTSQHDAPLPNASNDALDESLRAVARTGDRLTHLPRLAGNRVQLLEDGEAAYPRMLEAIGQARQSVAVVTYMWEYDRVGKAFRQALVEAKQRGVDVRVIIDGFGELQRLWRSHRHLRRHGVPTVLFNPPRLLPPAVHFNLRNHRKLLLIDGKVAFTGGMNIGARHLARDPNNRHPVRDAHFELCGPIVGQLGLAFAADWRFAARSEWHAPPVTERCHDQGSTCRIIEDGPNEDLDRLELMFLAAINAARHQVRIMTPYFLPSREMVASLKGAALRGVEVEIVLPSKNNLNYVHWAAQHGLGELLRHGMRLYYQAPPFCHSKLFLVDSAYAIVGSPNIDPRSLQLNFELCVEIYGGAVCDELQAYFARSRITARQISAEQLAARSLPARLRDSFFWLCSPYL